jgi:hypothetical protein
VAAVILAVLDFFDDPYRNGERPILRANQSPDSYGGVDGAPSILPDVELDEEVARE